MAIDINLTDVASESALNAHILDTANPHGVTKSQIGLENVDNTSDVNKPVSTAQQAAIATKQPLDSDLTAIAALSPSNDDFIQRKSSVWTNRTPSQVAADLAPELVKQTITDGVTTSSPSQDAVFDAFEARAKDIIICGAAATTLVDSTLYYYGQIFSLALQTSTDTTLFTPSVSGTIKTAVIRIRQAVNGSNEAVALDLKQGSNFNTIKSDIDHSFGANTSRTYLVTGLNISVVAGTNYELRLTVPNMTTNPTNVVYGTTLYIF